MKYSRPLLRHVLIFTLVLGMGSCKERNMNENSINKNQKFRNLLKGMITGLFTVEEYLEYKKNSSSLNKRMMNIILKRLQDNLQIFKFD